MPWSASLLLTPAEPERRAEWTRHPVLSRGLYHFPQLPHCRLPAVGLLAVGQLMPPEQCECDAHIPWDALQPRRSFQCTRPDHVPPAYLLAALSQMSASGPLLFYRGQTHGGEVVLEESWVFLDGKIQRYRQDPLVKGMAAIGARLPAGGWFEPFTSQFEWEPFWIGSRPSPKTPGSLYQNCQAGEWEEVERLLATRCLQGYAYPNPVTWALRHKRLDMARLLHQCGHPLSWLELSECRSAEAVEWMLQQGVPSHERCGLAMLESGSLEAWRSLGDRHSPEEIFLAACYGGVAELVDPLLKQHPEFMELKRMGDEPLTMAAAGGHRQLCQLLLEHGAVWSESALFEAAAHGHQELVEQAIRAGVSPLARRWGHSALGRAAANGHLALLRGLSGVDWNAPDQYGVTPLSAAALRGQETVVEWLLQQGVELETRDQSGCTPLWAAVASSRQSLVDLLLAAGANPEVQNAYGDQLETLARQRQIQLPTPSFSPPCPSSRRERARPDPT